uniref:ZP domain-containing protein n=1 Tax=Panagrolaimus superbus TaxID=310955 RepID=A0A914YS84_9BILA
MSSWSTYVTIGAMSLRNCMRECIDSTVMFCRSFEFDKTNDECFLVEESSEMSIPSATIDLYEPICLSNTIDIPCPGDNVFERIPNVNLVADKFIKHVKGPKVDYCMDDCLNDDECVSIVYDKVAKTCKLYAANRSVPLAKTASDVTTDLYELACDRSAVLKEARKTTLSAQRRETKAVLRSSSIEPPDDPCGAKLLENDRTLRLEYRNLHHVNVKTQSQCKELCMTARINCATFGYSDDTKDCLLSTTVVEKNEQYDMITQPKQGYNLYAYMGYRLGSVCHPESTTTSNIREQFFTTAPFTQFTNPTLYSQVLQTTPFLQHPHVTTASKIETTIESINLAENAFNFDSKWFDITKQKPNGTSSSEDFDSGSTPFNEENFLFESIANSVPATTPLNRALSFTDSPATISTSTEKINNLQTFDRFNGKKKFFDPKNSQVKTISDGGKHDFEANNTLFGLPDKEEIPRRLMETSEIRRVNISNVELSAICLDHGINVTFMTKHQYYTGAIYAAERFSQCRILVENKKEFSIFINRPSENNWCNALEVDNMMTVVLVMSNDLVLPFDVTTKDDLFYQITCDYKDEPEMALIHSGVIVGGPEPKSVVSSLRHEDQPTKVALRILKDEHPVNNVFIGEKLTALVESEVNTTRVLVTECNATRVGGREPRPNSVQLIVNGCSLMPQIISNMFTGNHGLQASLTAFRIDGSDQIDIACNVVICRRSCERKETCENVVKRHRRGASFASPNPIDILSSDTSFEDMVTVDQRLRVMVDNEDSNDDIKTSAEAGKNGSCLDPVYLLIVLGLFLLSVIALALSVFANRCHQREMSDTESFGHVEPIRSIPRLKRCII